MRAKEYLSQVSMLNRRIANLQHLLEDLREKLTATGGTDYSRERVKSSPPQDMLSDRIVHIVDLEHRLDEQIDEYFDLRDLITAQINALEDERYIAVLGMKYLQGLTLAEVAEEMHYEYKWCCRLHGNALAAFEYKYLS